MEGLFLTVGLLCMAGLVLVLAWPRKPRPTYRATVPASRWPPYSEP